MLCLSAVASFADDILIEGFEYGNHDLVKPIGWICDNDAWLCGYQEKDHNRLPHTGNWYAFSDADDAWMFMELYLFSGRHYRINCWAISDGECQFELWAGSAPNADAMQRQLVTTTVGSTTYESIAAYIDYIPTNYEYIGIRALTNGHATHLTIDDIEIDMVEQYSFEAREISGDTVMYPGTQAIFHFLVRNTGYDALDVTMHPSNEYFTDFTFYADGVAGRTFHILPDQTVRTTVYATLRPEVMPGTIAWLDINMTIPCNCNTALVTFWVTPLDITQIEENSTTSINIYPNPTTDFVTVEAEGLQQVTLMDITGKTLSSYTTEGNSISLEITALKPGIYFISAKTRSTSSFVKSILKM